MLISLLISLFSLQRHSYFLMMGQINIIFQLFIFVLNTFFYNLEKATDSIISFITFDFYLTSAIILQLYIFYIVMKKVGLKTTLFSLCYIYLLFEFIHNNSYNNTFLELLALWLIIIFSGVTFSVVFHSFFNSEILLRKNSLYEKVDIFITKVFLTPGSYILVIIASALSTRTIRIYVIDSLPFDMSLHSYVFIIFSLIMPSIWLFSIIQSIIFNLHKCSNNTDLCYIIHKEMFNIKNYNINNINFNFISTLCILSFFGVFILDLIPSISRDAISHLPDDNLFKVLSANEVNVSTNTSQDAPLPAGSYSSPNSPLSVNSPFFSDVHTDWPPQSLERRLWFNRFDSLADAKALDLAKRILLTKICLVKNITPDVQMHIQDYIWGNHWYELYQRHYTRGEEGVIRPLPVNYYHDESGNLTYAPNGFNYDDDGNFILNDDDPRVILNNIII